jgi:hypothetical protein
MSFASTSDYFGLEVCRRDAVRRTDPTDGFRRRTKGACAGGGAFRCWRPVLPCSPSPCSVPYTQASAGAIGDPLPLGAQGRGPRGTCSARSLASADRPGTSTRDQLLTGRWALSRDAADPGRVTIVLGTDEQAATATVGANGQFSAAAALPLTRVRDTNSAGYTAEAGGQRSLALQPTRRLCRSRLLPGRRRRSSASAPRCARRLAQLIPSPRTAYRWRWRSAERNLRPPGVWHARRRTPG